MNGRLDVRQNTRQIDVATPVVEAKKGKIGRIKIGRAKDTGGHPARRSVGIFFVDLLTIEQAGR